MNDHDGLFWELAILALVVVAAIVSLFKKRD